MNTVIYLATTLTAYFGLRTRKLRRTVAEVPFR